MRGEEKGINKASKAAHLAKGGFWRWVWGLGGGGCRVSDFRRCRETSSKLSDERQSPSHPRAGKAIQDYTDSSENKTDWVRIRGWSKMTCNSVKLVTTVLETGNDSFICLRIYTFKKKIQNKKVKFFKYGDCVH